MNTIIVFFSSAVNLFCIKLLYIAKISHNPADSGVYFHIYLIFFTIFYKFCSVCADKIYIRIYMGYTFPFMKYTSH